jgi:chemotaxis protein MotA
MIIRKIGTFAGLILGIASIFGAFFIEGGSFAALFLVAPLIIVFGGTFSAVIIGFGLDKFKNIPILISLAYFPRHYDVISLIDILVEFSVKSRKEGLLAVEKELDRVPYFFPRKLLKLAVDGTDPDSVENITSLEMKALQDRHYSNIFIFMKMGGYAPTMGILGTVMGLIMTLASAGSDPNKLVHNIASAFIATLWGVFTANIFWLPIADKLKECHLEEKHMMEISLEGVLAIESGEIPSVIRSRLISMLPQSEQARLMTL